MIYDDVCEIAYPLKPNHKVKTDDDDLFNAAEHAEYAVEQVAPCTCGSMRAFALCCGASCKTLH